VNLPESIELPVEDALTIAEALEKLESENPRQVQVVRCRFLLGMTAAETAAALHIGARTVEREWQEARAGLSRKLEPAKE
jgi:DNA-directed RNA polymerase specialized sigma24 family protein